MQAAFEAFPGLETLLKSPLSQRDQGRFDELEAGVLAECRCSASSTAAR